MEKTEIIEKIEYLALNSKDEDIQLRALVFLSGEIDLIKTKEKQMNTNKEMQDIMMQAFKCGMGG